MPKASAYTLLWLPERECYELREPGRELPVNFADESWPAWLATHTAFAFQGQQGKLTLLKEKRARGEEGYWYAYRSQNGRTGKRYLGRSQDLSIARLEEIASTLTVKQSAATREQAGSPATTSASGLLLTPKLHVPSLRSALVNRERLLARLDACLMNKLTLISAPAGFGKTTLVCQWIAERGRYVNAPTIAWVALDAGDNDPARFWRYIITSCQPFLPDGGQTALAHLQTISRPSPFESSSLNTTLTILLNELSRSTQRGLLVLEDYHVINEPGLHRTLTFFLDHLPETLRLVIIARSDPALPLARLRAKNELNELRVADLRFSRQETAGFLSQTVSLPISEEMLSRLTLRLEGWAAGLRLVALALQRQSTTREVERFLASLAGSHHSILEYFVSEVLDAQSPEIQTFLLATSALNRLTGSLCDAVTDRGDGAQILDALARANLFLEPLDDAGEWYRYHALFAESMQHEAKHRLGEIQLRALSERASEWYEKEELFAEAVEAALRARNSERAANLIERIYETATRQENTSELYTLSRWMEQLPATTFEQRPELCLKAAILLFFVAPPGPFTPKTFARSERFLQIMEEHAEARQQESWQGQALALRSMIAWRQAEVSQARDYADQALTLLPQGDLQLRGTALSIIARVEALTGQLDAARQKFLEARVICEAIGNRTLTRAMTGMLSGVCTEQGELRQAAAYLRQMLSEARIRADFDDIGYGQLGMAQLLYEWNDLDAAASAARETLEVGSRLSHEEQKRKALLMLARIAHARGQYADAQQQLAIFLSSALPQSSPQVYREALAWQAHFQLANGDFAAAQQWAEARPERDPLLPAAQIEQEELLVARLWLAQGQADRALEGLARLLDEARAARRTRSILEVSTLTALAYNARQQAVEAGTILRETLTLARPEGYLRLFLDKGPAMAGLLRAVLAHTREKTLLTYTRHILQTFAREPGRQASAASPDAALLNDPLSPQERRVLHLLASGRSNPEIARELTVSVNTVRTQVQSIYRKLNVSNRVAASELARDLQLLSS